jgi:hypothetical protein
MEAIPRNWKYYLGLALFLWSIAAIGVAACAPLLPVSAAAAAAIATAVVISAEIAFWASAALLGKAFLATAKAKIRELFTRRVSTAPQPVIRARDALGVGLLFASMLPYYIIAAIPFLGLPKHLELRTIILTLIIGEVTFIVSLFVLGGEFWARLQKLFQWPGLPPPEGLPASSSRSS